MSVKKQLESEGWYAIRASGSHGVADVVAIKPAPCGGGDHFIVRFIQIKCSENLRSYKEITKVEEVPFGLVNVEYQKYPVKSEKYHAHTRKLAQSKKKRPTKRQS